MKQKNDFKIFIKKSLVYVFFVFFLLFTSNVFAATDLTASSQPNIVNTLKTQSEVTLLNALNNANVISKLSVPATTPTLKNNIIHPLFKFNKVGFSLLGGSIVSLENSITSDYNNFILQPVSDVETAALLIMGDGLISLGNVTNSIYSNYVSFPKLAFLKPKISLPKMNPPNGNMLAAVVNTDVNYYVTDYNDYILRPVSDFETSILLKTREGLINAGYTTILVYNNIKNINVKSHHIFSFEGFFHSIKNKISAFYVDVVNGVRYVFTGTIHARNELCINNTCVTEAQLQTLLKNSETNNSNTNTNTTATASESNTTTTQN